jgi:hypothetical protein
MAMFSNNLGEKGHSEWYCELCDYSCSSKYKNERHNMTSKHILATNSNEKATEKGQQVILYMCEKCNKEYNDRSGLWRHKKKCNSKEDSDEPIDKELLMTLIKENMDLKKIILEIVKKDTYNNTNDFEKV